MMNRDGYRPIQRVRELAIYNRVATREILSSFMDEVFLYIVVTCCYNSLNWVVPRNFPPQEIGVGFVFSQSKEEW
jgi:hypothetical protein